MMKPVAALLMALSLSSCAAAAVVPAQVEQTKTAVTTLERVQETVNRVEQQQQDRFNDLCNGALVEGFDC